MSLTSSSDLVLVDLSDWRSSSPESLSGFRGPAGHSSSDLCGSVEFIDSDEFSTCDSETRPQQASVLSSKSGSILSMIHHQTLFNNRRYCTYSMDRYPLPTDGMEVDREDMKDFMVMEVTEGKHFLAPIGTNPKRILDLGTGTGIWAIEVGDLFPDASVVGVDLSPIQPRWSPPHVNFYIDDIEKDWLNGGDFDLIHARHVLPFVRQPTELLQKTFENLRPGGWIELQDLDYMTSYDDGTRCNSHEYPVAQFLELASAMWKELDTDMHVARNMSDLLHQAGFRNLECTTYKIPIGAWAEDAKGKSLGTYMGIVLNMVIPAMCHNPTVTPMWDAKEIQTFVDKCKRALQTPFVHAHMQLFCWQAHKPLV